MERNWLSDQSDHLLVPFNLPYFSLMMSTGRYSDLGH